MIVTIKRNKKQKIIKFVISFIVILVMCISYYFYMKDEYSDMHKENQQVQKINYDPEMIQNILLSEVKKVVDLIGQIYVKHIKMSGNKIIIVCQSGTNLDALKVRYGKAISVRDASNQLIVTIDANYIIRNVLK